VGEEVLANYICIDECEHGDVIVEDVYSERISIPVVVCNSVVDAQILSKLNKYNIEKVKIRKSNTLATTYTEMIEEFKSIYQGLALGNKLDMEKLSKITHMITRQSCEILRTIKSMYRVNNIDDYTYKHSINVATYAMLLGRWLNLNESGIQNIIYAGLLHDIGKSKIPSHILNKEGPLTSDEFKIMKEHPNLSYQICKENTHLNENITKAVLFHHEREDGSGYPFQVKGSKIDTISKIIGIADVYDALTSDRVYKTRMTPFDTFKIMLDYGYENKMDLKILNVFLSKTAQFYSGLCVQMCNGEQGEIVFVPPHNITYPIVKVDGKYISTAANVDFKIHKLINQIDNTVVKTSLR